jgi:TetR/AcrR family transcriptional repressor of nem operon
MRVTKAQKQVHHDRIVEVASTLFRERGYDGVGVAEVMGGAGLTHGGFYNHFRSKDDLMAAATARSFAETTERYAAISPTTMVDLYLSRAHRDDRAAGCPAAALSGEAPRQDAATRTVFGDGIEQLIATLAEDLVKGGQTEKEARARAIAVLAEAVGAILLSRACPDTSPLADEILDVCRQDCSAAVVAR